MTGFELQTSGIGSNSSANWATTTAQLLLVYLGLSMEHDNNKI